MSRINLPDVPNFILKQRKFAAKLAKPRNIILELPQTPASAATVEAGRIAASNILNGRDDRLLVVVGPCSIHDCEAAFEYAKRLKSLSLRYPDSLQLVMRVYCEKPRTALGWKGLIKDPNLDGSNKVNHGIRVARKLMRDITTIGLPVACEFLDPLFEVYYSDLVSWASIGARTCESQVHREMASGLEMPVGFKNSTGGDINVVIDAVVTSQRPHCYVGASLNGRTSVIYSRGNLDSHVVLRGDRFGPNHSLEQVENCWKILGRESDRKGLMVDCSHSNSGKDYRRQAFVLKEVCSQILNRAKLGRGASNNAIVGVMFESHLRSGCQKPPVLNYQTSEFASETVQDDDTSTRGSSNDSISPHRIKEKTKLFHTTLEYGVSITDGCVGWETTVEMIKELAATVKARRSLRESKLATL